MPLYTIIADHKGGTYISQHRARTPTAALAKWVQHDGSSNLVHGGRRSTRERLSEHLLDPEEKPVLLEGCVHVWCTTAIVRGELLLLDIVQTQV